MFPPATVRDAPLVGEVVPIPRAEFVSSQNKLALLDTVDVPLQKVTRPLDPVPVTPLLDVDQEMVPLPLFVKVDPAAP